MAEIKTPSLKPKVKSLTETKKKPKHLIQTESQVIVHFTISTAYQSTSIRIWKSTFLFPKNSTHISKLLHFEKISLYPDWTMIPKGKVHHFTLIFSGLPKDCKHFDLIEKIPQEGGFEVKNIARNKRDVYLINLD
ncbi:MAG: hypothetical protein IPP32_16670 [Bacteroidetes bacterium]|nr:hypothetical protein [Bacteroidota bacterium]